MPLLLSAFCVASCGFFLLAFPSFQFVTIKKRLPRFPQKKTHSHPQSAFFLRTFLFTLLLVPNPMPNQQKKSAHTSIICLVPLHFLFFLIPFCSFDFRLFSLSFLFHSMSFFCALFCSLASPFEGEWKGRSDNYQWAKNLKKPSAHRENTRISIMCVLPLCVVFFVFFFVCFFFVCLLSVFV